MSRIRACSRRFFAVPEVSPRWRVGALNLRGCSWPLLLQLQQCLSAAVVVRQLSFEERSQISDTVHFCLFDVLHTAIYVLIGLFVLRLLGTKLFLYSEILLLRFLRFSQ